MSDTPRADAMLASGKAHYMMGQLCAEIERELNEANADRLRLREALELLVDECMSHDFNEHWDSFKAAERILTTPPPPVVDKRDADALADSLEKFEFSAKSHQGQPMCPTCLCIPTFDEDHKDDCIFQTLQAYHAKYPAT